MKTIHPLPAVTLLLTILASSVPANAICSSPRLFSSGYSYVFTAGCEAADCGSDQSSVTDDLVGAFWSLGDYDPDPGAGIDSGTFLARGGWVVGYPGYPRYVLSHWAASPGIDGCIDFASDDRRCMVMLLQDKHPQSGDGVFALMTSGRDDVWNYDFEQEANGDITLSSMGRLNIVGTMFLGEWVIGVAVDGIQTTDIEEGLYLDPECGDLAEMIQGYEIYVQIRPRYSEPPDSSDVGDWVPLTGVLPLDTGFDVQIDCEAEQWLWLRAGLVFEGGVRSAYLSEQSTRLECYRGLAEPEDPAPRKPRNRERPPRKPVGGRHN